MDEGAPERAFAFPLGDALRRRLLWQLLGWHVPGLLAVLLLAAISESSILTGLTVMFLACVLSRAGLWHAVTTETAAHASHALYFWSYGAAVLLFALAAGVTLALAALADGSAPPELNWPLDALLPAAWCAGEVMRFRVRQSAATGGTNHRISPLPEDAGFHPVHITLGIEAFALMIATGAAAAGVGLSHAIPSDIVEIGSTAVIALVALFAAVQFALETRRLVAGVPIEPDLLRALTAAIGKAAQKTGAIRAVQSVEAIHTGPGTVLAIVQLEFKDGVAAQHMAPVVATLRAAAMAEVPQTTDVLLAPPPLNASDTGSR